MKYTFFLRTRTKCSFSKDIFSLRDKNHFKIFKSIIINDNRARQQRRFIYLIFTVSIMPGSINSTGLEHLSRCSNKNDQRGSLIIGVWDILNLYRKGGGSRGQDHLLSQKQMSSTRFTFTEYCSMFSLAVNDKHVQNIQFLNFLTLFWAGHRAFPSLFSQHILTTTSNIRSCRPVCCAQVAESPLLNTPEVHEFISH